MNQGREQKKDRAVEKKQCLVLYVFNFKSMKSRWKCPVETLQYVRVRAEIELGLSGHGGS